MPSVSWDKKTLIVGCIQTLDGLKTLSQTHPHCDLIELRVDLLLQNGVLLHTIQTALESRQHPVIITLRSELEGGAYPWKLNEKTETALSLLPYSEAIDLEWQELRQHLSIYELALSKGMKIVLSYHSLQESLSPEELSKIVSTFSKHHQVIYKIASRTETIEDVKVLEDCITERPDLALMGTGPQAEVSRQKMISAGSKLAYGYIDQPTAPNQPTVEKIYQMRELL
jgi:3-dehydroquinate dehydratase type I